MGYAESRVRKTKSTEGAARAGPNLFELCRVASEEDEVNGTKNYDKVIERVGRARQKYPSISKYYVIDYIADDPKNPQMIFMNN